MSMYNIGSNISSANNNNGSFIAGPGVSPRSKMEITVQRSRLVSPSSGKPFTMFEVEVLNGKSMYTIHRRYSQFLELYEKLKHRFGSYAVPQHFPGKRFRNNLSPAAVDKRHMKLKAWCEAVVANETLAKSMELREFIKNDNAINATAISSPGSLPPISSQQQQNIASPSAPAQIIARLHSGSRTWTDSGNSLLEIGFLYVWSSTQWKSRHFILRANALYQFKSPKHKNPSQIYIIEEAKVRKLSTIEGLYQFEVCIQKPQPKKLILAAKSEVTMENWMLAIRGAAKRHEVEETVEAPLKAKSLDEEESKISSRLPKIGNQSTMDSYESASESSSIENSDTEKPEEMTQQPSKIFGVPLSRTLYFRFVTKVLRRLRGLDNRTLDELFASEDYNIKAATALKPYIDRGECKFRRVDPPTLVGLLLLFLYELPEPLLTFELFRCFFGTASISSDGARINILKSLLNSLPKVHVQSLRKIINFLSYVVDGNPFEAIEMRVREVVRRNSAEWKCIETNRKQQLTEFLGNTFGPLILRPPPSKLKDMGLSQIEVEQASSNLVQFLINNSACIFREHGSRILLKNSLLQIEDKADDSTPPLRRQSSTVSHVESDVEMTPKKPSESSNRISMLIEERKVDSKSPVLYRRSTIITSLKEQPNQENFDNLPFVEKFKMIKQASEEPEPETNSEATNSIAVPPSLPIDEALSPASI